MSETTRKGGAETAAEPTYTKAEVDQLLAAQAEEHATKLDAGIVAEQSRIKAILSCDAAANRQKFAFALAFSEDRPSLEKATAYLESAAEEQAAANASQLDQLMQSRSPGISSDAGGEPDNDPVAAAADFILNA